MVRQRGEPGGGVESAEQLLDSRCRPSKISLSVEGAMQQKAGCMLYPRYHRGKGAITSLLNSAQSDAGLLLHAIARPSHRGKLGESDKS